MLTQYPFNKTKLHLFFNLGLHLNNNQRFLLPETTNYVRKGNRAEILHPDKLFLQFIYFLKLFRFWLETNETIVIINNDPLYHGYQDFFEITPIHYFEDPWDPGILSNPFKKGPKPDVIILVSARVEDYDMIMAEVRNTQAFIINLSNYNVPTHLIWLAPRALPRQRYIYLYLTLMAHMVLHYDEKKFWNLSNVSLKTYFEDLEEDVDWITDNYYEIINPKQVPAWLNTDE